ncbi:hypothetical protein P8452_69019 [Trifolium repens]|nr:hypothetical protein P8452_69019 [Trifolium repens]
MENHSICLVLRRVHKKNHDGNGLGCKFEESNTNNHRNSPWTSSQAELQVLISESPKTTPLNLVEQHQTPQRGMECKV